MNIKASAPQTTWFKNVLLRPEFASGYTSVLQWMNQAEMNL
jgi:hypothetical protein